MSIPGRDQYRSTGLRPRFEGANIRTWIGFKHFLYLAEEAVLGWFRAQGYGPSLLYHEHGIELSVADASVLLPATLDLDDEVVALVGPPTDGVLRVVLQAGDGRTVLRGKFRVAATPADRSLPDALVPLVSAPITAADLPDIPVARGDEFAELAARYPRSFRTSWRVPYFYCQYSGRVQHSGYVRALEDVVDRFLADRGISVGRMLRERSWIPVVSRVRVGVLGDAGIEETVYVTFTVLDIVKDTLFDARMDCWVRRGDYLVPTATARILHGYAIAAGAEAGRTARLDADVRAALLGAEPVGLR
ncbi:acyl-CoA thioesterase [Nocardia sp. NPDC051321]|uniref:acyl-CoA thioesterase n=1 Tax=Nocardia sp. NPDC051321 TaxID=3364323 RepID=UPI00379B1963